MSDRILYRVGSYEVMATPPADWPAAEVRARLRPEALAGSSPDASLTLTFYPIPAGDAEWRARFERRFEQLRELNHPQIDRYHDAFEWTLPTGEPCYVIASESAAGESLASQLARHPFGMEWEQVRPIFAACLDVLAYLEAVGVVHGNLTPERIRLFPDEAPRIRGLLLPGAAASNPVAVEPGADAHYAAPELAVPDIEALRPPADQFSLAVCLFQALTGTLPFPTVEPIPTGDWRASRETFRAPDAGRYPALRCACEFTRRCLKPDPLDRFPSVAEATEAFAAIRPIVVVSPGGEAYELREILGRGSFGCVYRSRRHDGTQVAIKELIAPLQADRFLREAKILRTHPHRHIVSYIDSFETDTEDQRKCLYLVTECLAGMPKSGLLHRIRTAPTGLDPAEVAILFDGYLEALRFLHEHERPIIHRDIKPANLYAPQDQPHAAKIFDLGVSRDISGTLTRGGVLGTLSYMAPELILRAGERGSPQSDLYALAMCLFESLTGQPPYPRVPKDPAAAFATFQARAQKTQVPCFRHPVFRQYPGLRMLLDRALDPDPARRIRTAADFQRAFHAAMQPSAALGTLTTLPEQAENESSTDGLGSTESLHPPAPTEPLPSPRTGPEPPFSPNRPTPPTSPDAGHVGPPTIQPTRAAAPPWARFAILLALLISAYVLFHQHREHARRQASLNTAEALRIDARRVSTAQEWNAVLSASQRSAGILAETPEGRQALQDIRAELRHRLDQWSLGLIEQERKAVAADPHSAEVAHLRTELRGLAVAMENAFGDTTIRRRLNAHAPVSAGSVSPSKISPHPPRPSGGLSTSPPATVSWVKPFAAWLEQAPLDQLPDIAEKYLAAAAQAGADAGPDPQHRIFLNRLNEAMLRYIALTHPLTNRSARLDRVRRMVDQSPDRLGSLIHSLAREQDSFILRIVNDEPAALRVIDLDTRSVMAVVPAKQTRDLRLPVALRRFRCQLHPEGGARSRSYTIPLQPGGGIYLRASTGELTE